jgi:glycerophosphoryl diester phosphodiesterase
VQWRAGRVSVYTVNREEEMQRLFALGVDGIFTDDPILAQSALKGFRRQAGRSHKEISR